MNDELEKKLTGAVKKLIKIKWITVDKNIRKEAVARQFFSAYTDYKKLKKRIADINHMFETMETHFPKEFVEFMEKNKPK